MPERLGRPLIQEVGRPLNPPDEVALLKYMISYTVKNSLKRRSVTYHRAASAEASAAVAIKAPFRPPRVLAPQRQDQESSGVPD